jgi:hypothetical protein
MIIKDNNISTTTSGMISEIPFEVKQENLGMLFNILRTKIYKDPIMAICREISCNARDAHREVGTPERPIEIKFPSEFNQTFEVKDYGPGISPDRMNNIFVGYGSSTKRDSNLQQGAFGLGAKTPFSYGDQFSIVTVVDGVKRSYSAYIDETEIGKVALASEEPTTEPNGTTIVVPVSSGDDSKFSSAIQKVTEYWDVKPIIKGRSYVEYKKYQYLLSTDTWRYRKTRDNYYFNIPDTKIIIDGIPYNINLSLIEGLDEKRDLLKYCFEIFLNIGDISLAASRDTIHYDNETKKTLKEVLLKAAEECFILVKSKLDSCPSYVEACKLHSKISHQLKNIAPQLAKSYKWNGYQLVDAQSIYYIGEYASVSTYQRSAVQHYNNVSNKRENKNKIHFTKSDSIIYFNDKTNHRLSPRYITQLFSIHPDISIIQIISTPKKVSNVDSNELKYKTDYIDLICNHKVSDVHFPKPQKKTSGVKKAKKNKNLVPGYDIKINDYYINKTNTVLDNNVGGVYIIVNYRNDTYSSPKRSVSASDLRLVFKEFDLQKVYGVTKAKARSLGDKWVSLEEFLDDNINKKLQTINLEELKLLGKESFYYFSRKFENVSFIINPEYTDQLSHDNIIKQYITSSTVKSQMLEQNKTIILLINNFTNITIPFAGGAGFHRVPDYDCSLNDLYKLVKKQLPLLQYIPSYIYHERDDNRKNAVIDYILLADKMNNKTTFSVPVENEGTFEVKTSEAQNQLNTLN